MNWVFGRYVDLLAINRHKRWFRLPPLLVRSEGDFLCGPIRFLKERHGVVYPEAALGRLLVLSYRESDDLVQFDFYVLELLIPRQ